VDDFARNGYRTVAIDYFLGNPVPQDALIVRMPGAPGYDDPRNFDMMGWVSSIFPGLRPSIDKVIAALKEQGVTALAATGYCIGGRMVFDLAVENIIKVSIGSHPSLLKVPEDFEVNIEKHRLPKTCHSRCLD
jgi:dienelactone hydrolase